MLYRREGLLLPEPSSVPVDTLLLDELSRLKIGTADTYIQLVPDAASRLFILESWHGHQDADLRVQSYDEAQILIKISDLKDLKSEVMNDESLDGAVKQLYRWKINEEIVNCYMLTASAIGSMKDFHRWNEFIYGKPDETIYRAALDWIANDADVLLQDPKQSHSVAAAAQLVADMLRDERGYRELLHPEGDTFEAVRADHQSKTGYYGLLLSGVSIPEGKIDNQIGDKILEKVIANIGSKKKIIDAPNSSWGVTIDGIQRPSNYNMPSKRFVGLGFGHEIGSHELERTNGARGPLALVSEGLDRYEAGNEGRAVIREQVPYATFDEFGVLVRWRDILRRHISLSYASGIGSDRMATSSEVYVFMNTIDQMYAAKSYPESQSTALSNAQNKTDTLLVRSLKGTDGKGGAYLKDKVYLEGHVANWLTAAKHGPASISNGDLGKFDISNDRHVGALQRLGLLPNDDDTL